VEAGLAEDLVVYVRRATNRARSPNQTASKMMIM
jgi:hypothetical protein